MIPVRVRLKPDLQETMFTGLVQSLAEVTEIVPEPPGVRLVIREPKVAAAARVGDSIAINGCCLTLVGIEGSLLSFQAGEETLSRTNLGELAAGSVANLEQSLRAGDLIGGHYVTGHIDAVATVDARDDDAEWCTLWFRAPAAQLAANGQQRIRCRRWREPHPREC